jgi:hypothetical protein
VTTELRLALRLIRGGGAAGLVRLALMTIGFTFGVTVVLVLATLPGVLTERGRVTAARQPLVAEASGSFAWNFNFGSWRGVRFTRVLVADPRADAPPPPGVTRLPAAGETVLSPAAADLRTRDSAFAELVRGRDAGRVGAAGLLGPDELYAYVGVARADLPGGSPGRGWGGFATDEETRRQFAAVPWELLLIVGAPAVIYFTVCARLSAATRTRRYAALRLVGAGRTRLLRIAAMESAVAGLVGVVLGLVAYRLLNAVIGPSGLLGFTWYPRASALSPVLVVATVVVLVGAVGVIGGLGAARAVARPVQARADAADRPPRWWYAAPFVFGLGLLAYPLAVADPAPGRVMAPVDGGALLAGVALASVGLLLALRPGLVGLARMAAGGRLALPLRLAARRVEHESAGMARHLAGLCTLVLVASIGAAVLRQTELAATPVTGTLTVKVNGQDVPAAARARMPELPAEGHWLVQRSVTTPPQPGVAPVTVEDFVRTQGVQLLVADCATLRRTTHRALPGCHDGTSYRVQPPGPAPLTLPAGLPVRYADADGARRTVVVPAPTIDLSAGEGLPRDRAILVARRIAPTDITGESFLFFRLRPGIVPVDRFAARLAAVAPAATLSVFGLDLPNLEAYRVHRGAVGMGMLLAFMLGIAAFLISAVGRAVERRRDVTALVVVGAPTRTLRWVQWTQTLVPLALALALATVVGHLAGNALLRLQGGQVGWFTGTVDAAWPMVAVALLAAAAAGSIVVGLRPRAEELRRE